jgi:hypothetical protein
MATKPTRNSTDPTSTEDKAPKRRRTTAKAKAKSTSKKATKASAKGVLSRKERLESVRKANQALLKALELMSHDQSDI